MFLFCSLSSIIEALLRYLVVLAGCSAVGQEWHTKQTLESEPHSRGDLDWLFAGSRIPQRNVSELLASIVNIVKWVQG